jgi:hypothetical protein
LSCAAQSDESKDIAKAKKIAVDFMTFFLQFVMLRRPYRHRISRAARPCCETGPSNFGANILSVAGLSGAARKS